MCQEAGAPTEIPDGGCVEIMDGSRTRSGAAAVDDTCNDRIEVPPPVDFDDRRRLCGEPDGCPPAGR